MVDKDSYYKKEAVRGNKKLADKQLTLFTWGNLSVIDRDKELIYIKPSGVNYDDLKIDDISVLDYDSKLLSGKKPSVDFPAHLEIYLENPEINSIVHTHSKFSTVFAQANRPIPVFGTTHADHFSSDIPVTRDLSKKEIEQDYEKNIGRSINELINYSNRINPKSGKPKAVLVKSHGPFVWGKDVDEAVYNAETLEYVAQMALYNLLLDPKNPKIDPNLLEKHYSRKNGSQKYYGQ